MSAVLECEIVKEARRHPGLLTSRDARFVARISRLPANKQLSPAESEWLYDIGQRLGMVFERPAARQEPIDYRARACA